MKLYFLLARRVPPRPSAILLDVFNLLRQRGFTVASGIAEELVRRPDRLRVDHDLYILKSHTELSQSVAGLFHDQGARLLNPFRSCVITQDKIVASRRLLAAGIPTPRSWITGQPALLRSVLDETPLIIKPHRGHRGTGINLVRTADELARVPVPESPVLIQEYVQGGEETKVYVVGDQVFGVRKRFSPTSFALAGTPCPVGAEVRDIAVRCGRAFGLGLYGLDVIDGPDGPVVVDLNFFPGYKGVPDVAPLIADHIEGYAIGRFDLRLPEIRTRKVFESRASEAHRPAVVELS